MSKSQPIRSGFTSEQLKQYFSNTAMEFRTTSQEGASTVKRYPATATSAVRFEKRMKREKVDAYQEVITHENAILARLTEARYSEAKTAQIVTLSQDFEKREHTVVTKSAGLDLFTWYHTPVRYEEKLYNNLFCHPLLLLKFLRGSLGALRSINAIGLIHCDLKSDQICLPFSDRATTPEGKTLCVDFDDIRIIDFGFSLWHHVVPLAATIEYLLKTEKKKTDDPTRYQSRHLIDHIQRYITSKKGELYSVTILEDIDYSVDIYSFGVLLHAILSTITNVIEQSNTKAWGIFIEDLRAMKDTMLSFDTGIIPPYSKESLPHTEFITKIEKWIREVEALTGHFSENIEVIFNRDITKNALNPGGELDYSPTPIAESSSVVSPQEPPLSPTPPSNSLPSIDAPFPIKRWLIGASVVIVLGTGYGMLPKKEIPNPPSPTPIILPSKKEPSAPVKQPYAIALKSLSSAEIEEFKGVMQDQQRSPFDRFEKGVQLLYAYTLLPKSEEDGKKIKQKMLDELEKMHNDTTINTEQWDALDRAFGQIQGLEDQNLWKGYIQECRNPQETQLAQTTYQTIVDTTAKTDLKKRASNRLTIMKKEGEKSCE